MSKLVCRASLQLLHKLNWRSCKDKANTVRWSLGADRDSVKQLVAAVKLLTADKVKLFHSVSLSGIKEMKRKPDVKLSDSNCLCDLTFMGDIK